MDQYSNPKPYFPPDPAFGTGLDSGPRQRHPGINRMDYSKRKMYNENRSLMDIFNYMRLANPKHNPRELLKELLWRDLDRINSDTQFGNEFYRNQHQLQQRRSLGVPDDMPFNPGSLWM